MSDVAATSPRYQYPKSPAWKQALTVWVIKIAAPAVFGVLRRLSIVKFFNMVIVTRFDDVQEVFARNEDFQVPYRSKVEYLSWKPNFLLGMDKFDDVYKATLQRTRILWNAGDLEKVAAICEEATRKELVEGNGKIDAMQRLMIHVIIETIERYYGIEIPEDRRTEFTQASLQICGFLFATPSPSKKGIEEAQKAITPMWEIIDKSIRAEYARATPSDNGTVLSLAAQKHKEGLEGFDEAHIRSAMMGMIMGLLPTNTNANGRILDVVMHNKTARTLAIEAAQRDAEAAGEQLLNVLFEALRFFYITPMMWRTAVRDTVLREGTNREVKIKEGRSIFVGLQSAMFDSRRLVKPHKFDPHRSRHVYLHYGHEMHYCVGWAISNQLLVSMFREFLQHNPRPAKDGGKMKFLGGFPWKMMVEYDIVEKEA